ncbi:sulfatase [Luteitalea sp. TBR-22]|uniref:DUF1501 domain-containing protein n=1 Tax=Luteitalea sp. TBR-22 TaxID=2802971 RepID=UPI001AF1E16E|nr:DUF1501 domain-containing protein [Luteitalea sp. TBR-22]BCS32415.1 sulfatase [Luteitalea sp. TBR-22]
MTEKARHPHCSGGDELLLTRRELLAQAGRGIGSVAVASMLGGASLLAGAPGGLPSLPHFRPKARRAIWLFPAGAPSQLDTWDYKPKLRAMFGKDLPPSVRGDQRLTTMTSKQKGFPVAPSLFRFAQHGQSGMWVSELFPHTARIVDRIALVRSLHTEAINHEPATIAVNSGNQLPGRPCLGSWLSYGLGSLNENLPTFVVMTSTYTNKSNVQALSARMWSSGFIPARHSGVSVRGAGDPVLYLSDPDGVDRETRRRMLDGVQALNTQHADAIGDPDTDTRIAQYEMAFRMQASVPELTDVRGEPESVLGLYGDDVRRPGTFAANCLLARRMIERGVRFVQIYHRGWDSHTNLPHQHRLQAQDTDRGTYGLITDLAQRGLLEDTLVIWGGEFGRTVYSQGTLKEDNYGRDHHPRCYSMWMAGGGVKAGTVFGETDDFSYNITKDPVHQRDLHATILNLFGLDHDAFTFRHQGLDQKLVGVEAPAHVVKGLIA